jgi:hypothetical protein
MLPFSGPRPSSASIGSPYLTNRALARFRVSPPLIYTAASGAANAAVGVGEWSISSASGPALDHVSGREVTRVDLTYFKGVWTASANTDAAAGYVSSTGSWIAVGTSAVSLAAGCDVKTAAAAGADVPSSLDGPPLPSAALIFFNTRFMLPRGLCGFCGVCEGRILSGHEGQRFLNRPRTAGALPGWSGGDGYERNL